MQKKYITALAKAEIKIRCSDSYPNDTLHGAADVHRKFNYMQIPA